MKIGKIVRERLRQRGSRTQVAGDVHAVVSANIGGPGGSTTHVASHQRVVQGSDASQTGERPPEGGNDERP